jgi:hypothetical protein
MSRMLQVQKFIVVLNPSCVTDKKNLLWGMWELMMYVHAILLKLTLLSYVIIITLLSMFWHSIIITFSTPGLNFE